MEIYRLVKYSGPTEWLTRQLEGSMPIGTKIIGGDCSISVAIIDPEDKISINICRNKFLQLEAILKSET